MAWLRVMSGTSSRRSELALALHMLSQGFGTGNDDEGGLSTYKAQLSIGLHIVIMMGTFFAAGFYGVSYMSENPLHVSSSLHPLALPSQCCLCVH
jgi:hypothetical protein